MPRISEETIQQVAAASDIVDVVGSYIQLKRSGSAWKALCPFHHEKTPSFQVNPARQIFKCFGCGAGGSVFRFVMDYENVDFATAVRRLAARAGISIEEESPEDQKRRSERDRLLALHRDAAEWFHWNLMKRPLAANAREYLKSRGINGEIATRWQIGFAPDDWSALSQWACEKGYSEAELSRGGLVLTRDRGDGVYDRFRNRVMFPICNDYGEVIAFSGRTLGNDPAKYVNSPETPLFTKGRVLFGLHKSKRAILAANEAIVCEGQLDLISMFEAGIENVTAPQGTAFTAQQARLLRRFAESAVMCFDSDAAGRTAVERSLPALLSVGIAVKVARMPAGQDPDSLIREQGAGALRDVLDRAVDFFDDLVDANLPPGASPQQRASLARRATGFLRLVDDRVLRETIGARLRARLELTESAFEELLRKAPRPDTDRAPDDEAPAEVEAIELSEAARLLCRLAIVSPAAREWIRAQETPAADFGAEFALVDKLAGAGVALEEPAAFSAFVASLPAPEERALAGLRLGKAPADAVSLVKEAWRGLRARQIQGRIAALQAKMRAPETGISEVAELHKQILDLQKRLGEV